MPNNGLPEHVEDNEILYRGVHPDHWVFEENRASSATFKDSGGVSVDRDGGRTEDQAVNFLNGRLVLKAIIKISAGKCRELDTCPVSKAEDNNVYHAEIHNSEEEVVIKSSKASKLAKNAEIVCIND